DRADPERRLHGLPVGRRALLGHGRGARSGRAAVHRPLFHRRVPDPPAGPGDRRGPQRGGRAAALLPGRRVSEAKAGLFSRVKIDWYLVLIILMAVAASVAPARGEVAVWLGWLTKILIGVVFFLH